ncbi:MAG: leucyl/phenylalanyl-tRNA--protein transferase [Maritimibacter sp.]
MSGAGDVLTPELLLQAYASGVFPMGEGRDDERVYWVEPRDRGILPLDGFHLSRSLKKTVLKEPFRVTLDHDFSGVVDGCAARAETWINESIFAAYQALFDRGHAHSYEIWDGPALVGGVYGVTLGGAFFGESMFSRRKNASKIALAYAVTHLASSGFTLFDTQFLTDHLASLGGVEIAQAAYLEKLAPALQIKGADISQPLPSAHCVVQFLTQTS